MRREIKEAAQQFLGALATFTATEIVEHRQFIFYTVITSMVALDRKKNKDEVISSPEVQTTVHDTTHLKEFMTALHGCKYSTFFAEFPGLLDQVLRDRRLSLQYRYVMRHPLECVPAVPHELQVGDDRGDGVGLRRGPGFHRHGDRGVHRIRPDRLQDRQSPRNHRVQHC